MKKILVLNFFPAFVPPASGGELRYYHIYNELSQYYDVTLLSPTFSNHKLEIVNHSDTFREYRIPKENIHDELHIKIDREKICSEVSALVCAKSADYPNQYHLYYNKLYKDCDIIIHDNPYMLNYDLYFGIDNKPRIYNSYNFEYSLISQLWNKKNGQNYLNYIYELEKKLVEKSDLVFAISEEERKKFISTFKVKEEKIKLSPNGIIPDEYLKMRLDYSFNSEKKKAFFIGSGHPPNIEAVKFIIENLSHNCPDVDFIVAGSCCNPFKSLDKKNVKLLGLIDERTKNELFATVDLAINPMFSGAGTNLKTLEFLSAGIPMISTAVGVRGLNLIDNEQFILADENNFGVKIKELVSNPLTREYLSNKGKEYINTNYSWNKIALNMHQEIEAMTIKEKNKKETILLLNDFPVANPSGGGEIRINKLYSNLSQDYRIILICFNNDKKINKTNITNNFLEISIPKTEEHLKEEVSINSEFWISATDVVNSYMCNKNEVLMETISNISLFSNFIILQHPYMVMTIENLSKKTIIYESLNSEIKLKEQILQQHPKHNKLIDQVKKVEKLACERSEFIISVSEGDHVYLKKLIDEDKDIITIKNGVEISKAKNYKYERVKELFNNKPIILFIGSGHPPNIQSVNFIIDDLARNNKEHYYIIVGSVCNAFKRDIPDNVLLFGRLNDEYKEFLFNIADIAINPMLGGSGSNLKLADYFAHKLPTITSRTGARGYDIKNYEEAIICDLQQFDEKINILINDKKLQNTLSKNSYNYVVNNLDWKVLAKQLNKTLKSKFNNKKKLLVVTYRATNPPLGGAEIYLRNTLKTISNLQDFQIDIATFNIGNLWNKFHFSIDYDKDNNIEIFNDSNINIIKFTPDTIPETKLYKNAKLLYDNWIEESIKVSLRNIDKYTQPVLLGGWHYPEKVNSNYEIWSSGDSYIYVNNIEELDISGYCPSKKTLFFYLDNEIILKKEAYKNFNVKLNNIKGKVLKLSVEKFYVENKDPRPLGIRIYSLTYSLSEEIFNLPLDVDYKKYLKEYDLDLYIDEMIDIADNRNENIEELFQFTRGPVSLELNKWLDKNISNYDIVLGHSIPFNTSVIAQKYADKYNIPVVLLPHFHIDDEFYYWKYFIKAIKNCTKTIVAPQASINYLYRKIEDNYVYVPGGGIHKEEYNEIDGQQFLQYYNSELPFVFVLGRKAGAKNYKWVIDAVKKVNTKRKICNLVMIGKDEDKDKVDEKDVIYLGEQNRDVVLGALKECMCLVNMSQSESFGIVILEAWMQNKPVIVNENCPAFTELVEDKVNGLYANKSNLHEKINYLLNNKHERERMGKSGRNIVHENYTWESIGSKINTILLSKCK